MHPARPQEELQRQSFSFYDADLAALTWLRVALRQEGVRLPRTTILRALIHFTSEAEFLAQATRKFQEDAAKPMGWGGARVAEVLSVNLAKSLVDKLDNVVDRMELKRMKMSRSDVMRSRLASPPAISTFAPAVKKFVEAFPDRRVKAARSKKSR